jgi:hypothetical protein
LFLDLDIHNGPVRIFRRGLNHFDILEVTQSSDAVLGTIKKDAVERIAF